MGVIGVDAEIVPICNPIYELYEFLKDDEYEDIVSYLQRKKKINVKRSKTAFSSIYLIFDFEHHYQKYSDVRIADLLSFFNNETEHGKLYISYPMIESFYHLKLIPDNEYTTRRVPISMIEKDGKNYKRIVARESCFSDRSKLTKEQYTAIIEHNYKKACKILNVVNNEVLIDYKKILEYELNCVNKLKYIDVISTAPLFVVDGYSTTNINGLCMKDEHISE